MADAAKSKYTHEWHHYWSDFDDFGVDRQLRVRAFDRHQYHPEPSHIAAFHGYIKILPTHSPA